MATSVTMPQLGESVTEGTVTRWLKQVGDHVDADEPLLEVSTDKVDTEIPSPASGILTAISANEDDVVEVGGELAVIGDASEVGTAATPQTSTPAGAPQPDPEPVARHSHGRRHACGRTSTSTRDRRRRHGERPIARTRRERG